MLLLSLQVPHKRAWIRHLPIHLSTAEIEARVLGLKALQQHLPLHIFRRQRIQLLVALAHARPRLPSPGLGEGQVDDAVLCRREEM